MTLEELQAQVEALRESNEALASKNRELLGEVKVAKAKAKGAEIDPEEHARLQQSVDELQSKLDSTTKLTKTEMDKLSNALKEKDGALQQHLIDGGLSDALAKAKIKPELMDAAKALLRGQAAIKAEGGSYQALMGDKPLHDAVTEWASGEQGKHFVLADANSGGGATGGGAAPTQPKGDLGGDKTQRIAALNARYPELAKG